MQKDTVFDHLKMFMPLHATMIMLMIVMPQYIKTQRHPPLPPLLNLTDYASWENLGNRRSNVLEPAMKDFMDIKQELRLILKTRINKTMGHEKAVTLAIQIEILRGA